MAFNIKPALRFLPSPDPIPESEIEAEARRILIDYPADPVAEAAARVGRLQWSKNARAVAKADRVLKSLLNMKL